MKTVLLATGQANVDEVVSKFENYKVIHQINYKKELEEACQYFNPDIVLVSEGLTGQEVVLIEAMIRIKQKNPDIRIIYLPGNVDLKEQEKVNKLGMLVMAGITDIYHEQKITVQVLKNLFDEPKTNEQMQYLLKYLKENTLVNKNEIVEIEMQEEEVQDIEENGYKNVFIVSSIKPGTGKSFVSTNLATAIAKYGKKRPDGKPPRVALIEADLQNLSVGTLLQIEDDKLNLRTVMQKISTIISSDGELIADQEKMEEVNHFIKSCFKPYYHVKNLEALVGSQLTMEEIENVQSFHYIYLIESILNDYDVIVIDSNSSLAHVTTYPLLRMAKTAYYIINLDFNNVRNNARYQETLQNIGVFDKVKYILNEDIVENKEDKEPEQLIFNAEHLNESGFNLEARIPMLPKTVFLNRLYEGTPVVLDDREYTLKTRLEIETVANQIWGMENLENLQKEYDKYIENNIPKKRSFFGK
ncbi:TPA: AAA family ATPase [Clostridium botulinum]|nr:AAA family ATPase [Clostridium botulinum]